MSASHGERGRYFLELSVSFTDRPAATSHSTPLGLPEPTADAPCPNNAGLPHLAWSQLTPCPDRLRMRGRAALRKTAPEQLVLGMSTASTAHAPSATHWRR